MTSAIPADWIEMTEALDTAKKEDEVVKIVVTKERYDDIMSIDDGFYLMEKTDKEVYKIMCNFVVGDDGKYLSVEDARKAFSKIPRKEFSAYIMQFLKAIGEAFVPPTNGAA